ncbi:MAG: chloride channel protein [Roseburia sp.]|nr:chloride channel protein [Roseburia sp.]
MKDIIKNKLNRSAKNALTSIKWVIFAAISGTVIGSISTMFHFAISIATMVREKNTWILFLLPIGGLIIVRCYRLVKDDKELSTNSVLSAIHSNEKLPLKMAPLIFVSTVITHLFGGSAGREGAALQLGGSIGNGLGQLFRFNDNDKHIMIMCGMSAAFSALFGTPMAAAIFSMEVISVGIMQYSALVPCVIASLSAFSVAQAFGVGQEQFLVEIVPNFTILSAGKVTIVAVLCAVLSIAFCVLLHQTEHLYKKLFKNPYLRVFVGGCLIIVLTLLVGDQTYNGTGMHVIEEAMEGHVVPYAFLLKMIFTAVTIGAGYKGGEIVPSFFIGATFGCLFGNMIGFAPDLCAAVGMTSLFCGVTNCPITSLLISFELFGYEGMPYYLLAVAFSYMLSGYYGLYSSQRIMYSKYRTKYINRKPH